MQKAEVKKAGNVFGAAFYRDGKLMFKLSTSSTYGAYDLKALWENGATQGELALYIKDKRIKII